MLSKVHDIEVKEHYEVRIVTWGRRGRFENE